MQKAIDIRYVTQNGNLLIDELNGYLDKGWKVVATEYSGGGDILVIVESPEQEKQAEG